MSKVFITASILLERIRAERKKLQQHTKAAKNPKVKLPNAGVKSTAASRRIGADGIRFGVKNKTKNVRNNTN